MKNALFITIEGPDGSGKTTVSKAICERLQKEGYLLQLTREPGGSKIAEQIRSVILDPDNTEMDARTEALLYAASRRQHLVDKVLPALEKGIAVVSERFVDSSLAYQGIGRRIGMEAVWRINEFAIEGCLPDKTIYLDIDAETGLERIQKGRNYLDRLDQEEASFHDRVFKGYQEILTRFPERFIKVDAGQDIEKVVEDTYLVLKGLLDAQ
ncbi:MULTISPECIES: dTMP kinase [Terrabacteria group]|uniref:dTMP kinase n=1 Tax=Bacillati TaxID=1783272 RepID=UPI001C6E089C|nr:MULTISPECIES: dTMP kinase [Terrabacteria group]MBW9212524.1 dTMP kinase [Trueperella sp. zg.1013]